MNRPYLKFVKFFTSVLLVMFGVATYAGGHKVSLCHITGTYDSVDGEIPIGRVISIPNAAYSSHINHGDPEVWAIVELPDGTKFCTASSSSSRLWDDFLTPSPPVELTVSSEGVFPWEYVETETEHYLDSTGTLRAFRIRHTEHDDGISVSQWGSIGGGLVDYSRTVSPSAYRSDFFELQYDNASGTTALGGERFDVTDDGTYNHMVFHFHNLQASTTYLDADTSEYVTGSRMCLGFYTDSHGYLEFQGQYLVSPGGSACRGVLLTDDADFEVEISYLDDFAKEVPYECEFVEDGIWTLERFELVFGAPYEVVCDTNASLSHFQNLYGIIVYIDGADTGTLSGITLENR